MMTSDTVADHVMAAKAACRERLQREIGAALAEFTQQTGLSIAKVSIPMIDVTTVGSVGAQFVVGPVRLDVWA